jgi:hypothetical protein
MGYTIVHYCYNDSDLGTHDLMRGGEIRKVLWKKIVVVHGIFSKNL